MTKPVITFLLVDDLEGNLLALEALLRRDGVELLMARSGREALELLLVHDVSLAFLDVQMPEMDGFELAELMRGTERTRRVPIIFVTAGATDRERQFRGFELGAVDFIVKPIDPHVLRSKAEVFYELACQRRELQTAAEENARLLVERTQTEQRVRESEERMRQQLLELEAIYQTAPLGLCVIDTELRFRRMNQRLAEMNGIPSDAHLGRRVREILPALSHAEEVLGKILATGEPMHVEIVGQTPAAPGLERVWDEHMYPLRDQRGNIVGIGVVAEEVTERRRVEQALRESESLFRTLADNLPQLAWMMHADGHAFWFNHRWFDYTGTTLPQMEGSGWYALLNPSDASRVQSGFREALESGDPWEDTFQLRGKNGQHRWFLSRAFPVRDEAGRIFRWFGTNTDITDLRETEEALQRAQSTIRVYAEGLEKTVADRTAKLRETVQELEAFSYSIAHDMRAPLRSMQGYAQILVSEHSAELSEEAGAFLGRISASARRLDQLIQDILNYSRIVRADLPLSPVDTRRLIDELIDSYPHLRAARDCITIEPDLPAVYANSAGLTQVLSNLLGNAVKFVAPGVTPSVRIWGEHVDGASGQPPNVRLWIEDNGIGIDPAVRPRLFQMFQRFAPPGAYQGTGIGLAIAHKATERMGGKIGYESAEPHGSRFWIMLPASAPQTDASLSDAL